MQCSGQLLKLRGVGIVAAHHKRLAGVDRQLQGQALHRCTCQFKAQGGAIANGELLLGFAFP